jgi:SOS-response transcriptional repressor LexA
MSKTLAQRLKTARAAMHPAITQRDMAKKFNVTAGSVSLWESGSTEPNSEVLAELARTYKVSVDWLVGLEDRLPVAVSHNIKINTVPVIAPTALGRWRLEAPMDRLQTLVAYTAGTAAAMLVSSDALSSVCPTGCYAVVSKAHEANDGAIVMAVVGDSREPILRRLIKDGGESMLIADDARWPTVRLNDGARIIGPVTEIDIKRRLI